MICSFLTNDVIYKYISNTGNNLTPYSIAIGEANIYFLSPYFKFFVKEKINESELLNTNENSVDPFDCHISNSQKKDLKKYENIKFIRIILIKYSYKYNRYNCE